MYPCLTGIPIHRDYHMTFFISDPLSILGPDIAVRQPVDSKFDITTNYDLFLLYDWHEKIFSKIDEFQCDTDYGKGYDILRNRVIYIFYQHTKGFGWLTLLSIIFELFRGGQFYCWRKPEKITDLPLTNSIT